jgi:hypothetical protein
MASPKKKKVCEGISKLTEDCNKDLSGLYATMLPEEKDPAN